MPAQAGWRPQGYICILWGVPFETYVGLTGSGFQDFTAAQLAVAVGIHVTAIGVKQTQLEPVTGARFARLGYLRTYNHLVSFPPFDDGYYLNRPLWIDALFQVIGDNSGVPLDIPGADGFFYYFYPDVVATLWWSY